MALIDPNCACYVKALEPVVRFGLHYGAHALDCPTYRVSRDPVDAAKDIEDREHLTGQCGGECDG